MSKFGGLTNESKTKQRISIPAPKKNPAGGHIFPIGQLKEVKWESDYKNRKGEVNPHISFNFIDSEGRVYVERAFKPFEEDSKFEENLKDFNSKCTNIYTVYSALPDGGIGADAETMDEYCETIVKAFNTNGPEGVAIFKNKPTWMKLVYYKGNLQMPKYSTALQLVVKDKPCILTVDYKFDKINQEASLAAANAPSLDGGGFVAPEGEVTEDVF